MLLIPESSRQKARIAFLDEDYQPFVPTSIRYRLDDQTDTRLTTVLDWQDASTLDSTIELTIPATANAILNDQNPYETRVLTIQSDYGTDNQLSQDVSYRIRNLSGFL